jgi:hypothetical protein
MSLFSNLLFMLEDDEDNLGDDKIIIVLTMLSLFGDNERMARTIKG